MFQDLSVMLKVDSYKKIIKHSVSIESYSYLFIDKKIQTNNKLEELDLFSSMIPFERLKENVNLVFYE